MSRTIMILLLCLSAIAASQESAIEPRNFNTEVQEKRYRALISELRCTVCQNEPIESSNAPLAADLREQVYNQIMGGQSDSQIRQYMRDRYGDFVLYKPPFTGRTLILYLGPVVLLLAGLVTAAITIRRRRRMLAEHDGKTAN